MSAYPLFWRSCALVLSAGLWACAAPPFGGAPPAVSGETQNTFQTRAQKDVDILFVIDNSRSMVPKQRALAAAIPRFMEKIEASGTNYHVGVVTTDVGSWTARGVPFPGEQTSACSSFEGDDGRLQREACSARSGLTDVAVAACQRLCPDPRFIPEGGAGFIRKVDGQTNVPKLLDTATQRDLGPQRAFQCLALVGDGGCGIEAPLESAQRALDGHREDNRGFLREGSALALIFIGDEDDCSVAPRGRAENDPRAQSCPLADADAGWECFNRDFRCLARSTRCDQPLNTPGKKTGCVERSPSYLEPVSRYVEFFKRLRPADRLIVAGIWTPQRLEGGKLSFTVAAGAGGSAELNRAEGAEAGCVDPTDPGLWGYPQHRLSRFLKGFPSSVEVSICDTANYPSALARIADTIQRYLQVQCLAEVPKTVRAGGRDVPACLVGDVSDQRPSESPQEPMPACGAGCCEAWSRAAQPNVEDPAIRAACQGEAARACFCAVAPAPGSPAEAAEVCKGRGKAIAAVWRKEGPAAAPPDTSTRFVCAF